MAASAWPRCSPQVGHVWTTRKPGLALRSSLGSLRIHELLLFPRKCRRWHNKVSSFAIRTKGAKSHYSKVMQWAAWARGKIVEASFGGSVAPVRGEKKSNSE